MNERAAAMFGGFAGGTPAPKPRQQTDEEMAAVVLTWATKHNARSDRAKRH
jgi:hypothetical protein